MSRPAQSGAVIQEDQEPAREKENGDSYIALRLQVENGEIRVVGANVVAGPLVVPDTVRGGLSYEVTLRKRRLGLGDIPDVGVMRGFPPPDEDPEVRGHSVVETSGYSFTARIPNTELSRQDLADLNITVYRL